MGCYYTGGGVRRVNLDNGTLHQSLGADQLVVRRVVHDVEHTRFACADLRAPAEVASVQTQSTVLNVAATAADLARALGADLGHGHLATHLELPLHVVLGLLAARQPALVLRITGDAHDCR
jgi:hypothetical protein